MRHHVPHLSVLLALGLTTGCEGSFIGVSPQQTRAQRIGQGGFLALDLLATRGNDPIACDDGSLEVQVSVTAEGPDGHFTELPQSYVVACDDGRTGDLALVVDNSGSEDGYLPWLRQAASTMATEVIGRGGRTSLVRVSTQADVVQPLTADAVDVDAALDGLFITNGWTALWDGVRLGQETLGDNTRNGSRTAIESFCFGQRPLGVAAFTDGMDNNSADEKAVRYDTGSYPGDGVDTRPDDLVNHEIQGAVTPVYTLGLGRDVDHDALQDVADATGARYRSIDRPEDIPAAFGVLQSYFDATHQVCVELPELECGDLIARVDWTWTGGEGEVVSGRVEDAVTYTCADTGPTEGRIATILLTLGDPGIPTELSSQLALQAVEWAAPKLRPRVLIVLDDSHNGEDVTDVELVQWLLADVDTLEVGYLDEPEDGLLADHLEGYDVVWYANPGYPMDELSSFEVLEDFVADGGGLVLQGDDMTWSKGKAFDTSSLTGLDHVDNGTKACGQSIDNRKGGTYTVTIAEEDHAMSRGLEGTTFTYANDIDASIPLEDERMTVLAWAVPTDAPTCTPRPVITGFAK